MLRNLKWMWAGGLLVLMAALLIWPCRIWPLELVQSFALQYVVLCSVAVMVGIVFRQRWAAGLAAVAAVMVGSLVAPYLMDLRTNDRPHELKVGVLNVLHTNTMYADAAATIMRSDMDIFCAVEVSHQWDSALAQSVVKHYPYAVRIPNKECCWGISVFSRYEIVSDSIYHWTRDPVIWAQVLIEGRIVDVWAAHTRPPIFPNDTEERNLMLNAIAMEIRKLGNPAILLGDLNIVPWAKEFRALRSVAGMDDSRRGPLVTYPMQWGIPLIPIDHVLHTEELVTESCETMVIPGSDHKALVAGLSWR